MIHPRMSTASRVLRETVNGWAAVPTDEIRDYCARNEAAAGSFLELCNAAPSVSAQLRLAAGSVRRLLQSDGRESGPARSQRAEILAHVRPGGRHAVVWVPIVRDLLEAGLSVGCTEGLERWDGAAEQAELAAQLSRVDRIPEPRGSGSRRARAVRVLQTWGRSVPWRGLLGASAALAATHTEGLVDAWKGELEHLGTRLVITTTPYSPDGHALRLAARSLGIPTVCVQVGLANGIVWPLVVCEGAIVWSALGEQELRRHGWGKSRIEIAACPSVPSREALQELRATRRRELGLGENARCALFLGQRSVDQVFQVQGYRETVAMVAAAFLRLRQSGVVPLIRPHVSDTRGETESLLADAGLRGSMISRQAGLFADLAAADVAVSMHSAALEEAHLAGLPIIQVAPPGCPVILDFRCIGAILAHDAESLAGAMESAALAVPGARATISAAHAIQAFLER